MKLLRFAWHVLRGVLIALAAIVLLIEEWGWRPLAALAARIAQWPPLSALERHIRRAPPRLALLLFLAPAVLLFPLKLAALWIIEQGRVLLGISIIVLAKLVGTALVGRLFVLLEPQLMQFAWFASALRWSQRTQQRMKHMLRASAFWKHAGDLRRACRDWWQHVNGR